VNFLAMPGPRAYMMDSPTAQSVSFAGHFINLSEIARVEGLNSSYLSRIFSGERNPTIPLARRLANALKMDIGEFIEELEHLQARRSKNGNSAPSA
jgi:transcriptional regulator with XRE-family HTH domain